MGAGWAISKAIHACTVKTAEKTTEQGEPRGSKWGKRSLLSRASFDIKTICIIIIDSRYVAKRCLNLKATVDVRITTLFLNWLPTVT